MNAVTPRHAVQLLDLMLDMLGLLFPDFHAPIDRADLTEARIALEDVRARLERQPMEDT